MKRTITLVVLALTLMALGGLAHDDDAGIDGIMREYQEAWNRKDATALAALCTESGTYIDWTGNQHIWAVPPEWVFRDYFEGRWKIARLTLVPNRTGMSHRLLKFSGGAGDDYAT